MKNDAVKYALNQISVIEFLKEKFPKSEYMIAYNWNPFNLEYMGFSLIRKELKAHNPFTDEGLDENLYRMIMAKFPDFKFLEQLNEKRKYEKEFLLQFLITLQYEYSEDRLCRELFNPFTGEKLEVIYNEFNKPTGIKNTKGEIVSTKK